MLRVVYLAMMCGLVLSGEVAASRGRESLNRSFSFYPVAPTYYEVTHDFEVTGASGKSSCVVPPGTLLKTLAENAQNFIEVEIARLGEVAQHDKHTSVCVKGDKFYIFRQK